MSLRNDKLRKGVLVVATCASLIIGIAAGAVLHTTRAAASTDAYDLQLMTPLSGWVLTTQRLARTDDGGASFRDITPPGLSAERIAGVQFADASHGWVATSGAPVGPEPFGVQIVVHRTSDGGATWSSSIIGRTTWGGLGPVEFAFADSTHGFMQVALEGGDAIRPAQLLRTTDGLTWTNVMSPARGGLSARASGPAWLASERGGSSTLYRSVDGGVSWQDATPTEGKAVVWGRPVFRTDTDGLLVGAYRDDAQSRFVVLVSHDSGLTWSNLATVTNPTKLTAGVPIPAAFPDATTAMVVTPRGDRVVTVNNGQVVSSSPAGLVGPIARISFVDSVNGWALSMAKPPSGRAYRTTDGGRTWLQIQP